MCRKVVFGMNWGKSYSNPTSGCYIFIILEAAVQEDKVMQDFELESPPRG